MGRGKAKKFALDYRPLREHLGWQEIIRHVQLQALLDELGPKRLLEELGVKRVLDELGLEHFVALLSPQQCRELQRLLQKRAAQDSTQAL